MEIEIKDGSKEHKKVNKNAIFMGLGIAGGILGLALAILPAVLPKEALPDLSFPTIPSTVADTNAVYSDLTGIRLASAAEKTAPAYCVQTPNGMDGARPQAGLNEAGVVFEAIAEAGITRFAAIYQNPSSAVIGPIRSLRLYYLQWDTPFDCTIVHAGGADDALEAVRAGDYKDLSENYAYMYRGTYGSRLWNNLFTTSSYLAAMNADWGYGGSNVHGFNRMTPTESTVDRVDRTALQKLVITEPANGDTYALSASASNIEVWWGDLSNFNVNYSYDPATNTYLRSYASGATHDVYDCPAGDLGEVNPEDNCTLTQLAPSVVVAMVVDEHRASDNYHEDIATLGSGEAYVFQNGYALHGSWRKDTVVDQIKFFDDSGAPIALAPGQTFVEAVPSYGGVAY